MSETIYEIRIGYNRNVASQPTVFVEYIQANSLIGAKHKANTILNELDNSSEMEVRAIVSKPELAISFYQKLIFTERPPTPKQTRYLRNELFGNE